MTFEKPIKNQMETEWNIKPPPEGVFVKVLCDDYTGEYIVELKRATYKRLPWNGKKNTRGIWRWLDRSGCLHNNATGKWKEI